MNLIDSLDFKSLIEKISEFIKTEYGFYELKGLSPLTKEESVERMCLLKEIINYRIDRGRLEISEIDNIGKAVNLIIKGAETSLTDIIKIRRAVNASEILRKQIHSENEYFNLIKSTDSLRLVNLSSLNLYLSGVLTDSGELVVERFPALRKLQNEIDSLKKHITSKISSIVNSPVYDKHLQEKIYDTRGGRFVILVKSSSRGALQGRIYDVSSSMQTVYFEPEEIREHNAVYSSKQFEFGIEVSKAVAEIAGKISDSASEVKQTAEAYGKIDFLNAVALFSELIKAEKPVISDKYELVLYSARHPVLYVMMKDEVVSNDIIIRDEISGMVISGANAGGKTVVLKTAGLCALMIRYGFLIPASPDSRVCFFDNIYADIGDDQSIAMSLSTYSGQIRNITEMITGSNGKSLVLIDEIISGTNPHYGSALARAVLENMADGGIKFIVTTHYPELKKLAADDPRFLNASVVFDPDSLKPTYILKMNLPGMSYTFEIAKIMNMPVSIVDRAKEIAGSEDLSADALLEKLHRYESDLVLEKEELNALRNDLNVKIIENSQLELKLKQAVREAKEFRGIEFVDQLKTAHEKIQERIRHLNNTALKDAEKIREEIITEKQKVETDLIDIRKDFF